MTIEITLPLEMENLLRVERRSETFYETATAQEWNEELRNWTESHRNLPTLPDEAFERESYYPANPER